MGFEQNFSRVPLDQDNDSPLDTNPRPVANQPAEASETHAISDPLRDEMEMKMDYAELRNKFAEYVEAGQQQTSPDTLKIRDSFLEQVRKNSQQIGVAENHGVNIKSLTTDEELDEVDLWPLLDYYIFNKNDVGQLNFNKLKQRLIELISERKHKNQSTPNSSVDDRKIERDVNNLIGSLAAEQVLSHFVEIFQKNAAQLNDELQKYWEGLDKYFLFDEVRSLDSFVVNVLSYGFEMAGFYMDKTNALAGTKDKLKHLLRTIDKSKLGENRIDYNEYIASSLSRGINTENNKPENPEPVPQEEADIYWRYRNGETVFYNGKKYDGKKWQELLNSNPGQSKQELPQLVKKFFENWRKVFSSKKTEYNTDNRRPRSVVDLLFNDILKFYVLTRNTKQLLQLAKSEDDSKPDDSKSDKLYNFFKNQISIVEADIDPIPSLGDRWRMVKSTIANIKPIRWLSEKMYGEEQESDTTFLVKIKKGDEIIEEGFDARNAKLSYVEPADLSTWQEKVAKVLAGSGQSSISTEDKTVIELCRLLSMDRKDDFYVGQLHNRARLLREVVLSEYAKFQELQPQTENWHKQAAVLKAIIPDLTIVAKELYYAQQLEAGKNKPIDFGTTRLLIEVRELRALMGMEELLAGELLKAYMNSLWWDWADEIAGNRPVYEPTARDHRYLYQYLFPTHLADVAIDLTAKYFVIPIVRLYYYLGGGPLSERDRWPVNKKHDYLRESKQKWIKTMPPMRKWAAQHLPLFLQRFWLPVNSKVKPFELELAEK